MLRCNICRVALPQFEFGAHFNPVSRLFNIYTSVIYYILLIILYAEQRKRQRLASELNESDLIGVPKL
jgi:hypothetical protein